MEKEYESWLDNLADNEWDKIETEKAEEYVNDNFVEGEDYEDFDDQVASVISNSRQFDKIKDDWKREFIDENKTHMQPEWLSQQNLGTYLEVSNNYDLKWPYKKKEEVGNDELENLADEYSEVVGEYVEFQTVYHKKVKRGGVYTIEPDSSINLHSSSYSGLEFVSPPLSFNDAVEDLKNTQQWAKEFGCYTDSSTGLHINISVPNIKNVDYVKLILLSGDSYILNMFDRGITTYCKSASSKLTSILGSKPEIAKSFLAAMKGQVNGFATRLISQNYFSKLDRNTSINLRGSYIEVRSSGGDWLNSDLPDRDSQRCA